MSNVLCKNFSCIFFYFPKGFKCKIELNTQLVYERVKISQTSYKVISLVKDIVISSQMASLEYCDL